MSRDGVRLRGVLVDGTATGSRSVTERARAGGDLALVACHGFTNHVAKPAVRRVLTRLARHVPVVALDFRGHGRSAGRTTLGADEVHDVAAAVDLAHQLGYPRVATIGFSLGASVVLRHAALGQPGPDADVRQDGNHGDHGDQRPVAVVAVSSPSRWWVRETPAMRRVHWLVEQPHGRALARALGVRLGPPWAQVPPSPIEVVHRIAPTPLLLVHGEQDHYFPPDHALALHRAAGGGAELWLEPETRHSETAMTPDLVDRIASWLVNTAGPRSSDAEDDS